MKQTYVQIDLDALANNVKEIKNKYSNYEYHIAVLKGDAYGHGEYIVNTLTENGINYIAVSCLKEILAVRLYNKEVPILCLQPLDIDQALCAIDNNATLLVHDMDYLNELIENTKDKSFKVHLKVDAGMNRLGFKDKISFKNAYDTIIETNRIIPEGVYQHFATVGIIDPYWDNQVKRFKDIISLVGKDSFKMVHMCNGVTTLTHPKIDICNAVRIGFALYGYNVSPSFNTSGIKNKLRALRNSYLSSKYKLSKTYHDVEINLKPAMKLISGILQIKDVKKGEYVGYNASYFADENIKIAVLPIGYNNGIGHNNISRVVSINGNYYPIIGEIGMNMITVKVDNSVNISDTVVLLGDNITIGRFSRSSGAINPESLINIGKNNTRKYISNNQVVFEESRL